MGIASRLKRRRSIQLVVSSCLEVCISDGMGGALVPMEVSLHIVKSTISFIIYIQGLENSHIKVMLNHMVYLIYYNSMPL